MRIAIFSRRFPVLSQTFVINQITGLIDKGVDVDVLTIEVLSQDMMHDVVKKYSLENKIIKFGFGPIKSKLIKNLFGLRNMLFLLLKGNVKQLSNVLFDDYLSSRQKLHLLSALIERNGIKLEYDNIICHFGDSGYFICKLRDLGLINGPVSTVFHGYEMSCYDVINNNLAQYKQLFIKGDLMLPISELWEQQLIQWGCEPSKIKVHRMGVAVDDFCMINPSKALSLPLKVIQVGRLTEKKAILNSINAVALAAKNIAIEFTVIGDGELFEAAKELISSLDANEYIFLLGCQEQAVVKGKLDAADAFLLPSVRAKDGDMEGIPVALMESMAKGLITISTYHSGIPELIENEVSGFLVVEHDINALVNCFIKVSNLSIARIENIRVNARKTCVEKFNNERLNDSLTLLFT